jgi:hypothetical protein
MDKIFEKLEKLKKLASPDRKGVKKPARARGANAENEMDTSITDHRHRMTEQEEDEELMENDDINEENLITRFDASPWCKFILVCCFFAELFVTCRIEL